MVTKNKVYCSKCKYFKVQTVSEGGIDGYLSDTAYEYCLHPSNLRDTYLRPGAEEIERPKEKNHLNRCKDYRAK